MALRVTFDLSALASGIVAKNRPLGRPEAHACKSNVTHRAIHYLLHACIWLECTLNNEE